MYKFLLFFLIPFLSFSQMREKPLLFSHKGEYIHTFSKFAFPDYWEGFNKASQMMTCWNVVLIKKIIILAVLIY